jgi:probable F420-dependent oxidoreductase
MLSVSELKIGLVYPQTEFGNDPAAIQEYAQTAEGLGFSHILAYDHVLGANPDRPGGWGGPYTYRHPFQEPLVLFSFMAALTRRVEFTTGVIILPQRQTALFAKQAATLDVLSGGRVRVGIGNGWNPVEYVALNEDFHNRGKRIEEQVAVLRQLWAQPLITFEGRWHHFPDAGLNPLPSRRSIPLWFGGHAPQVLRRAAALGDGWMPNYRRPADALPSIEQLERYLEEAGRPGLAAKTGDRSGFGIEARIPYGEGVADAWRAALQEWAAAGATHVSFNTMGAGFTSPDEHLQAIHRIAAELALPAS